MAVTPHRDFDARPRTSPATSGSFKLGGTEWKIRGRDAVPYELMRTLIGDDDTTDVTKLSVDERRARARRVFVQADEFYAQTIAVDQVDAFLAMVHDPHGPFSQEMARELPQFIAECLFGDGEDGEGGTTPTKPSELSRAGRRATGSTSKAASSSRATAKRRSGS